MFLALVTMLFGGPELALGATPLEGGPLVFELRGRPLAPAAVVLGELADPEDWTLDPSLFVFLDEHGEARLAVEAPPAGLAVPARAVALAPDGTTVFGAPITVESREAPVPGAVLLTEIFYDPSFTEDRFGEWVELHNASDEAYCLDGFAIGDAAGRHEIRGSGIVLGPGECAVLGRSAAPERNGDARVDYAFGGDVRLHNRADTVWLAAPGGTRLDAVRYGEGSGLPDPVGRSLERTGESSWRVARTPIGGRYANPDRGTPGAAAPDLTGR